MSEMIQLVRTALDAIRQQEVASRYGFASYQDLIESLEA